MTKVDLYKKHLRALKRQPVVTEEPPGLIRVSPAHFFEAVAGMGERARKNGTIARSIRDRKKK